MRWLHLSDLHFGRTTAHRVSEEETWKSLIDHVRGRTREGLGPDYIFITGDVSWDGEPKSFQVTEARIEALCREAGFDFPQGWGRVFAVPGNHDVWHPREPTEAITFHPAKGAHLHARFNTTAADAERLRDARKAAGEALDSRHQVLPEGLQHFADFLNAVESKGKHFREVPPESLSFYSILTDSFGSIAVVGFCTAWACYDSRFDDQEDTIPCGARLVRLAVEEAKKHGPKLIVLLGHHPSKYLYDFNSVLEACHPVPTLYLRGHRHVPGALLQHGVVQHLEVGSGALHLDIYKETERPHGIMWGRFDGETITIEPMAQSREFPSYWSLDTSAWPNRNFQNYCLVAEVKRDGFYLPQVVAPMATQPEFVGIGLASLGTLGTLDREFKAEDDFKTDFIRLWEPELGTFATIMCRALAHWGRSGKVGLLTSMGDDAKGITLRQVLKERDIQLLFCRRTSKTGRQFSLTPRNTDTRYNIDDQVRRPETLTELEEAALAGIVSTIAAARCVAFDKYELAIVERIFNDSVWRQHEEKPIVLFESGSRPLSRTRAGRKTQQEPELRLLSYIDIFTTTWEWTRDLTGFTSQPHPESWRREEVDRHWNSYREYLEDRVAPIILPAGGLRPRFAVISLSRVGSCLVHRNENGSGFAAEFIPVLKVAEEISSRQGAGDMLRAALVEQLLSLGGSTVRAEDPFLGIGKEGLRDAIGIAQYAVYLWLRRYPGANYFSGLEADFEEIVRRWRAERTKKE